MSGMAGFDGREPDLAIGSVTGARWWHLQVPGWPARSLRPDELSLAGVNASQGFLWEPGENNARCLRRSLFYQLLSGWIAGEHEVPEESCACGFWAYWQVPVQPNPHSFRIPVLGVIEGWGRTLIGDRGFRCARARITALHIDNDHAARQVVPLDYPVGCAHLRTEGAVRTWQAMTGRRSCRQAGSGRDEAVSWLAEAELLLGDRYGVPVYATRDLMLDRYPLTAGYLPPGERRIPSARRRLTAMEALERVMLAGPDAAMLEAQHAARGLPEPGSR